MRRIGVVALAGLVAAACARSSAAPDDALVVPLEGQVLLVTGDDQALLDGETDVEGGDLVVTGPDGRALLDLGPVGTVEIGPESRIRVDRRPELMDGSVLARAADSGLVVRAHDAEIAAEDARGSVFRVDRAFTVVVAVYRGAAEILGSGIEPIPALRQVDVVGGETIPKGPRPLEVNPDHPWDILYLGSAIDLGIKLTEFQRGLARQLTSGYPPEAVVAALEGVVPETLVLELLHRVSADETIMASEVSRFAAQGPASLPSVLDEVLDFRGEGAHWIVVAARWRLGETGVLGDLERMARAFDPHVLRAPRGSTSEGGTSEGDTGGGGGRNGGSTGAVSASGSGTGGGDATGESGGSSGSETSSGSGGATGGTGGGGGTSTEDSCSGTVDCLIDGVTGGLGGVLGGGGGGGSGSGGGGLLP